MPHAVSAAFTVIGAVCFWFLFASGVWTWCRFIVIRILRAQNAGAVSSEPDDDADQPDNLLASFKAFRPPQIPSTLAGATPAPMSPPSAHRVVSSDGDTDA